jgi:phosphoribosylformylglycinamidine (FGAM) synthase-like amidotransferase family enzyme
MARSKISPASVIVKGNVFGLMPHPDRACERASWQQRQGAHFRIDAAIAGA